MEEIAFKGEHFNQIANLMNFQVCKSSLIDFLKVIYKHIAKLSGKRGNFLGESAFGEFLQLPRLISGKIFNSLDVDSKGYLNLDNFVDGLTSLYLGKLEQKLHFAFSIFDFNSDGIVCSEDVTILLSHFHMISNSTRIDYLHQVIANTFPKSSMFNFSHFSEVICNENSDIYLLLMIYLIQNLPFTKDQVSFYAQQKKEESEQRRKQFNSASECENKTFFATKEFQLASPSKSLLNYLKLSFQIDISSEEVNLEFVELMGFEDDLVEKLQFLENEATKSIHAHFILNRSNDSCPPFKDKTNLLSTSVVSSSSSSQRDTDANFNPVPCIYPEIDVSYLNHNSIQLKKGKLVLVNNAIFQFLYSEKIKGYKLRHVITLKSAYVKQCEQCNYMDSTFFPFIIYSTFNSQYKEFQFFGYDDLAVSSFVDKIRTETKFSKIEDHYIIDKELGKGQFGSVRCGINKHTGEKVAIKILNKNGITYGNYQMIQWEKDVFKFLKSASPSGIVQAKEMFETLGHLYLVYELIEGPTLTLYKQKVCLSETKMKDIAAQLLEAVEFLHQYGIVHRDIKPDNILVDESSGKMKLKLIDFGLSKIMGKNDLTGESYGSLLYAAPEILTHVPYNHKVDIWSIGVLLFFLKYSTFPFDEYSSSEASVRKSITHKTIKIPTDNNSVINLMIKASLQKSLLNRASVSDMQNYLNN